MNSHLTSFGIILLGLLLLMGCTKSNSPTGSTGPADEINWESTSAIYNSFEGKKEYSVMFFYTDWCPWCAKMDEFTFTDQTVVDLMNRSFNCTRVNAESDTLVVHFDTTASGREMKIFYDVSAYPTISIFKGDGQHIYTVVGFTNAVDFAAGLNRVLEGIYD